MAASNTSFSAPIKSCSSKVHLRLPVTIELKNGAFALISEADLENYNGLVLRPTGTRRLDAAFPFDPEGWTVTGPIVSPWRVTLVAADLHRLVNSDVIPSLNPPPDAKLFPKVHSRIGSAPAAPSIPGPSSATTAPNGIAKNGSSTNAPP